MVNAELDYKRPSTPVGRGYVGLGLVSLFFALAFLPAPLAVLFEMNDQCLRATSWGTQQASWGTLYQVPPTPMPRAVYLMARTTIIAAELGALFLIFAAIVSFRSRTNAIRLHAVYFALQLVLMTALALAAHRFTTAIVAGDPQRDWLLKLLRESSVGRMGAVVAGLGLLYPLVLALLYWGYARRGKRPPVGT